MTHADLTALLDTVPESLATWPDERIRPSKATLDSIMESLR